MYTIVFKGKKINNYNVVNCIKKKLIIINN